MANKRRKRYHKKRRHSNARSHRRSYAMHSNPRRRYRRHNRAYNRPRYQRRRNPGLGGIPNLAYDVAAAVGGGIVTRSLPQMILKEKNTGAFGYLANLGTALIGFATIKKFAPSRAYAFGLGAGAAIGSRLVEDFLGKRLVEFAQLPGLLGAYGDSAYDLSGLSGEYVNSYFSVPTISDRGLIASPPALMAAPPSVQHVQAVTNMAGMGKYGSKYAN